MMPTDLIDRLNTYRLDRRISQVKLAEELGVAFQTVNRWLNRHVKPSPIQAHQIQKLLNGKRVSRTQQKKESKADGNRHTKKL